MTESSFYLLWYVFPDKRPGDDELIIKVYHDVLSGKRKNFPRGYFLKNSQVEHRAIVCFRYLCEEVLKLDSEGICRTFTKTYGIKTLSKYKLKMLVDIVYESLFHLMNAAYPELSGKLENYRFDKRRHEKEGNQIMPIDNAFATHPGKAAEASEKKNEDFAHAWVKDAVSYQIIADGNGRSDILNPAAFAVNEIQRFIDSYSEPGMSITEIKRMISGAFHCANRVLLAFKKSKRGALY